MRDLVTEFGRIDIYVFDQLLRGNIPPGARVLDAGCGGGRNLIYLLRAGYEIFAVDSNPDNVEKVRGLAASLAPRLPRTNFRAEAIETMTFPDEFVDVVLSSAVLHFARDDAHFQAMLRAMWRMLAPGGLFFCRLASSIGIENRVEALEGRRHALPYGTERFLVDEPMLLKATGELGGTLVDPLKTTIVQDLRAMTTWVVRKG